MEDKMPDNGAEPRYAAPRRKRKTLTIVLLCILIGVLVATLIVGMGWWQGNGWNLGIWINGGDFEVGNLTQRKEFSQSVTDVQAIEVDLSFEDLVLQRATGNEIVVQQAATSSLGDDDLATMQMNGGTLVIRSGFREHPSSFFGNLFGGSPRSRVTVSIPTSYAGQLSTLTSSGCVDATEIHAGDTAVKTSSGDVNATGLACGALRISTTSGEQELHSTQCALLSMDSSSGDIGVADVQSADAVLQRTSGNLNVSGLDCANLECSSSSGDTVLQEIACGDLSASSTSGGIEIGGSAEGVCRVETSSGDISVQGEALALQMTTTSGEQTATIEAPESVQTSSSSGNVRVEVEDASSLTRVECEATSGDVTLCLPRGTAVSVDHHAASGDLDFGGAENLQMSQDGIPVSIRTSSGDARIESWS